jgi:hypothetical protein
MCNPLQRTALCVALLAATRISAQTTCDTQTPVQLLQMALDIQQDMEAAPMNIEAAEMEVGTTLEDLPTSPSVSGAATASTISNFLPLFALTGLGGDLEGASADSGVNDDMLGFDFNMPLSRMETSERQLKLQAGFNRNPELLSSLLAAVPAAERDAFRTRSEQDLTITDDTAFSVVYNVENQTLGRNRALLGEIFEAAIASASSAEFQVAFATVDTVMSSISTENQAVTFAEMDLPDEQKVALCEQLTTAVDELARANTELNDIENFVVSESRIETFAQLINNQPQLYASVTYRDRNPLVGANEKSVAITYEWGYRANVNLLRKFIAGECGATPEPACRLAAFRQYVSTHSEAIDSGDRLKFSLEYSDVDDLTLVLTDPVLTFAKPGGKKLVSTLAYGRALTADIGLFDDSRIDFEIRREDIDDDPDRNNRTIASLTITRSIGDLAFPFSIVYANKPEFLATLTDDKLSAHFGIKYEFAGK